MFTYVCIPVKGYDFYSYSFVEVNKENVLDFPEGIPLFDSKEAAYDYASFANMNPFSPNVYPYSKILKYKDFISDTPQTEKS